MPVLLIVLGVTGVVALVAATRRAPAPPPPKSPPPGGGGAPSTSGGGGGSGGGDGANLGGLGAAAALGGAVGGLAGGWFWSNFGRGPEGGVAETVNSAAWVGAGAVSGGALYSLGASTAFGPVGVAVVVVAIVVATAISQWVQGFEDAAREARWRELYDEVQALLAQHGREDADAGGRSRGGASDAAWAAWNKAEAAARDEQLYGLGFRLEGTWGLPKTVGAQTRDGASVRVPVADYLQKAFEQTMDLGDLACEQIASAIPWRGGGTQEGDTYRWVGDAHAVQRWADVQPWARPEQKARAVARRTAAYEEAKLFNANGALREELAQQAAQRKAREADVGDVAVSGGSTGGRAY